MEKGAAEMAATTTDIKVFDSSFFHPHNTTYGSCSSCSYQTFLILKFVVLYDFVGVGVADFTGSASPCPRQPPKPRVGVGAFHVCRSTGWLGGPRRTQWKITLQGINISHLGKRKIIFKMQFLGDMLVSWRVCEKILERNHGTKKINNQVASHSSTFMNLWHEFYGCWILRRPS